MQTYSYQLRFQTPAFLGNALQQAQWRTPPIKALLRQWWRVAYAKQARFKVDLSVMRREEALLFGHAWLEDDYVIRDDKPQKTAVRKSDVRLRLKPVSAAQHPWTPGTQQGVQPMSTDLGTSYAWYGLVKRAGLPDRNAIKARAAESEQLLQLAVPQAHAAQLEQALALISALDTLGSRSRGGWGSVHIAEATPVTLADLKAHARPIGDCLCTDWAMSLALDEQGLCVWHSRQAFPSWDKAMAFCCHGA